MKDAIHPDIDYIRSLFDAARSKGVFPLQIEHAEAELAAIEERFKTIYTLVMVARACLPPSSALKLKVIRDTSVGRAALAMESIIEMFDEEIL